MSGGHAGDPTAPPEDRVLVFTATYNERDNIAGLSRAVLDIDRRYDLLIVDDDSPDGTGRLIDELRRDEPRIAVVHRPRKMGLGSAHKLAVAHAIGGGYSTLVTMDADWSHDPADIPRLVAELRGADFVIGSRHMAGGRIDYGFYRRALSVVANGLARLLLGIPLHEFTTSFRAFRVPVLGRLDVTRIRAQGYAFFVECVFHLAEGGFALREIPIHFRDRRHGSSKISRLEIVRGATNLLRLFGRRLSGGRAPVGGSPAVGGACPACGLPYLIVLAGDSGRSPADRRHRRGRPLRECLACGHRGAGGGGAETA